MTKKAQPKEPTFMEFLELNRREIENWPSSLRTWERAAEPRPATRKPGHILS